ncbi:G-protein coupled receptor 157-like [Gigantopelta aegis]|uniref:G-protein coupled receptor 157-like n=1 Tax=Gigantopelta aegis TaxID=1735272 RepID=UPI001B88B924|nr:G-protein coupled receptor 157-like [Gigantopelta aegis]
MNTTDHPSMKPNQTDIIYAAITGLTAILSMAGSSIIVATYIAYKDCRIFGRQLLAFLSVADFLTALGNLLGVVWFVWADSSVIRRSMIYCKFQSALTIFSSIASFLWMVVIAFGLLLSIVLSKARVFESYGKFYHLVCWVLPGLIVTVSLSLDVLGYDSDLNQDSWCWVDPRVSHALVWQFVTGKGWELASYVITVVIYTVVKIYLFKNSTHTLAVNPHRLRHAGVKEANRKLTFVPLVFILLRVWGTLRFIIGVVDHEYAKSPQASWIVPLQCVGDSAQGIANCVIYCFFTTAIRRRLVNSCCCVKRRSGQITEVTSHSIKPSSVDVI